MSTTTDSPVDSATLVQQAFDALGADISAALPDVAVVSSLSDDGTRAVALVPLSITRLSREMGRSVILELRLRALVVPLGPQALTDAQTVLLALERRPGTEVEAEEPPLKLWELLQTHPRPSVIVRQGVPVPLTEPAAPVVLAPLRVAATGLTTIEGIVVGPGDVPLPFAEVRSTSTSARVLANRDGSFRLAVPTDAGPVPLSVAVVGRTFTAQVSPSDPLPILIHCEREET